jgi:hypothetical protein
MREQPSQLDHKGQVSPQDGCDQFEGEPAASQSPDGLSPYSQHCHPDPIPLPLMSSTSCSSHPFVPETSLHT